MEMLKQPLLQPEETNRRNLRDSELSGFGNRKERRAWEKKTGTKPAKKIKKRVKL